VQFFPAARYDTRAGAACSRGHLDKLGLKSLRPATVRDRYAPGGFQALFDAMTPKGIKPRC